MNNVLFFIKMKKNFPDEQKEAVFTCFGNTAVEDYRTVESHLDMVAISNSDFYNI